MSRHNGVQQRLRQLECAHVKNMFTRPKKPNICRIVLLDKLNEIFG